jgi:hypothetical protein
MADSLGFCHAASSSLNARMMPVLCESGGTMALSTAGKHYTPVLQRIQEAIYFQHFRSLPPRAMWEMQTAISTTRLLPDE